MNFSVPDASDGNSLCGFVRSDNVVAESAVVDWLPGPGLSVEIAFVWTPIHGRFRKSNIIKTLFSDIARNLTAHIDFIEPAPKNPVGRPRTSCRGFWFSVKMKSRVSSVKTKSRVRKRSVKRNTILHSNLDKPLDSGG